MNTVNNIPAILSGYTGITLEEVQRASLMRRKDSKYLFCAGVVPEIIAGLNKEYLVLEIEKKRVHSYQTHYYDTSDLKMYHMHHRGMVNRHKIRFRRYDSSNAVFFEVKKKNAKGITIKNRMQTDNEEAIILSDEEEFLASFTPYEHDAIQPVLENSFNRITLVHPQQSERVTIDYEVRFSNPGSTDKLDLSGVAIAEIKYEARLSSSPFHLALRNNHIPSMRFSKYCIGMAMLNPHLKQNLFKTRVRLVNKLNCNMQNN